MENPIGYQYRHLAFSWVADGVGRLESRIVITSGGQEINTGLQCLSSLGTDTDL